MNTNEQNTSKTIQDLLKYIADLKQEQANLQNQYNNLYTNHIHVDYRKKGFLDIIIPNRYEKFKKSYIDSQRKERKLKKIDNTILSLQIEIEENENFLYKLQQKAAKSNNHYQDTINKNKNNKVIEHSIDD